MRKASPPLLAILRTRLQGELLAHVYLRTWDAGTSISDLARQLGAPIPTVQREVSRLVDAGLLEETIAGRMRFILKPHDNDLIVRPLTQLLAATFGPLPVLTELVAHIPGVQAAFLYGSWAARYQGEAGPVPNDVDVLLVGDVSSATLDEIAESAEAQLGRRVDIRRVTSARWAEPDGDPFVTTVQSRPLVALKEGLIHAEPLAQGRSGGRPRP